jgi:ribosome modulation factor
MDRDLRDCSRPFRQGYGARVSGRPAHENPYLGAADLAGMYACRQWIEGWREAAGADRTVRRKINEISREIAQEIASEIKRSSDEACRKD